MSVPGHLPVIVGVDIHETGRHRYTPGIDLFPGLTLDASHGGDAAVVAGPVTVAIGAIVAVAHDILVTVSLLTFFGYELSLNVVAAMLTITGYSVNDSIVVFDRVRENLRVMRRDAFDQLVNTSINQTLARTIITSGTTSFAVLALYLFGGECGPAHSRARCWASHLAAPWSSSTPRSSTSRRSPTA